MVFGRGDVAARALSGLLSVATLPFFWQAGRRVGGRLTGWVVFFLALTSPFAIQYAATARMYSLMILLSVLGFLTLEHALEAPTRRHLVELGIVTALILYTHYWGVYLVVAAGAWLLYRMFREHRAGVPDLLALRPALRAMLIGSLFFLPWSPIFVFQTLHTGTPWTGAAGPADLIGVFGDFSGGGPWGRLLGDLYLVFLVLGLFGRPALRAGVRSPATDGGPTPLVTLVTRPNRRLAGLTGVLIGTLLLAVVAGAVANAAFIDRYTAVALPLFLLVVGVGITVLTRGRIVLAVLLIVSVAGVLTGYGENNKPRTQAVQVAQILNAEAQPGDLVVYCPDQLGPAVDRLLTVPGVTELTFPRAIGPSRVNWVNYRQVIDTTNVATFAQQMLGRLGAGHGLWVVEKDGYPGLGGDCGALVSWFNLLRPTGNLMIHQTNAYFENENLIRYPS
ncbi:MAG: glycosyltransferase family 39 protein, partial [Acidimicrobiaceae bacterium]|nr:glycosyltransferase family 39 protein [Acidimicrobiaceae bacterium]